MKEHIFQSMVNTNNRPILHGFQDTDLYRSVGHRFDILTSGRKHKMAENERAYTTSYPWSIVTITLFCTVFKIQSSKDQWVTDLTSQGHSRSKPMAAFERASMTSYSTVMVTMALSASVSKLQPSEICLTSIVTSPGHCKSKPMAPVERASMTSYW